MAEDVEHLLDKMTYKDLLALAKDENIEVKGKKIQLVRRLKKDVNPEKIRAYFCKIKGAEIDITRHKFVPKHEIMKKSDIDDILKKYHCNIRALPVILDTDPMAMKIGAKVGDIIEITRKSATAGVSPYYRRVIRSV